MIEITCFMRFDAAHRIAGHEHRCSHLHGHGYGVEVTVSGPRDELGRVIDFSVVKERLGGEIDRRLDHSTILGPADEVLAAFIEKQGWKIFRTSEEPTAEALAHMIAGWAMKHLSSEVKVERVRVRETPNCWADWIRGS